MTRARRTFVPFLASALLVGVFNAIPPSNPGASHATKPLPAPGSGGVRAPAAPVVFEENQGQVDARVRYLAHTAGSTVFVTPEETVWSFTNGGALRMHLDGATSTLVKGIDPTSAVVNYFHGDQPAGWKTGVPTFHSVEAHEVSPGVDMVWHGKGTDLEYDLVVAPGTDPAGLRLDFDGADKLSLDGADLVVSITGGGEVRHGPPHVYQDLPGGRSEVAASYAVDGSNVGFEIGEYDHSRPLVIDPIVFSKFVGGGPAADAYENATGVAVDGAGNIVVTGETRSPTFPLVNPADSTNGTPNEDAFVYKLDPTGTNLIYSTYLSGSGGSYESGGDIAVDSSGNAYVTGRVSQQWPVDPPADFPVTAGAYDGNARVFTNQGNTVANSKTLTTNTPTFVADDRLRRVFGPGIRPAAFISAVNSPTSVTLSNTASATGSNITFTLANHYSDAFLTKLSPAGSIDPANGGYSTFLRIPGTVLGTVMGVSVDGLGDAFVGGTADNDGPSGYPVGDGYVLKMNPTGTARSWLTLVGGSGNDSGTELALDGAGNTYLVGGSGSDDFPVTPTAMQPARAGDFDATLARLDPAGTITYATYLGGTGFDGGFGVGLDNSGHVYLGGLTLSTDFPTSAGAFQTAAAGGYDSFVAKLDLSLPPANQRLWSTDIGGSADDTAEALAVDGAGQPVITGETNSANFPTASPIRTYQGNDAFVVKFNSAGTGLVWSTYLGGSVGPRGNTDTGLAVASDTNSATYVVGQSLTTDFPNAPGQPSPTLNGNDYGDTFVTKFTPGATPRPTDFNANGTNEVAVFRPSGGVWYSHDTVGSDTGVAYGTTGDIPLQGDFDGDGFTDTAIYRPSVGLWAMHLSSSNSNYLVTYGISTDVPVPADYDGDGKTDIAVFRPSTGAWYVRQSSTNTDVITTWGISTDVPVPYDYDGDGKTDIAIFRNGGWYVHPSAGGDYALSWGTAGDVPLAGDFDGDGAGDYSIFRPSTGLWATHGTTGVDTFATYGGINGDVPVPADYDRDGKADIAIWRPVFGTWFVHRSSDSTDAVTTWGISSDTPLPLPYSVRSRFYP